MERLEPVIRALLALVALAVELARPRRDAALEA